MAKLFTVVVLLIMSLGACVQAPQIEDGDDLPVTDENGFIAAEKMRLRADCSREDGVYIELWEATAEGSGGRSVMMLIYEGEIIASVAEFPAILSVVTKEKATVLQMPLLGQGYFPRFVFDEVLASKGLPPWTGEGCF